MQRRSAPVFVFLILVAAVVLVTCSEDEETPTQPEPTGVLVPLTVGNTWEYIDTMYTGGNNGTVSTIVVTADTTVTVGTTDYDCHVWRWHGGMFSEPTDYLVRNESNGLWNLGVMCPSDAQFFRVMWAKYPASTADTWSKTFAGCVFGSVMAIPGDADFVESGYSYATPAGTFSCYRYHERYVGPSTVDVYYYIVPDIGVVGMETFSDGALSTQKWLTSYDLR
jgi:hypothetical protein